MNLFKIFLFHKKIGLAIGSGGTKGLSAIPIIQAIENQGIKIDIIAGSSIGAIIGTLYILGRLEDYKQKVLSMSWRESISLFDPIFPSSGLLQGKRLIKFLMNYIPENTKIENLKKKLAIVATDYYSGKPVIFTKGNLLRAIRASIAVPGIFTPVRYKDTLLIDGGVADPVPVDVLKKLGANITLAINFHPTVKKTKIKKIIKRSKKDFKPQEIKKRNFFKKIEETSENIISSLKNGADSIGMLKLMEKWFPSKQEANKDSDEIIIPNIFEIMNQAIDIQGYLNTHLLLKYYKPDILFEPNLIDISTLDYSHYKEILAEGEHTANMHLSQLKLLKKIA